MTSINIYSMYIKTPTIKPENIFKKPFKHIEINNVTQTTDLHTHYLNNSKWKIENNPDHEGVTKWSDLGECLDQTEFKNFFKKQWLEQVFCALELQLPNEYLATTSMAWHSKGMMLKPHTDGPGMDAFDNLSRQLGKAVQGCVVQSMYILDTDKYSDTGMWLHDSDRNLIKQIKCLPGNYVAYQNTEFSLHSVPKQQHEFARMLINLKTFW